MRKNSMKQYIAEHKKLFVVYMLLRISVILVAVAQFFNGNYENFFLCILTLILFTIPSFVEKNYHIDVPDTLEVIILLFIYSAEISEKSGLSMCAFLSGIPCCTR